MLHEPFRSFGVGYLGYLTIVSSQQLEICNRMIKIRPTISRRKHVFSLYTTAQRMTHRCQLVSFFKHQSSWCLGKRLNFPKTDMAPARMTTESSHEKNPKSCYRTTFTYPKDLGLAKLTTTGGLVYWFAILWFWGILGLQIAHLGLGWLPILSSKIATPDIRLFEIQISMSPSVIPTWKLCTSGLQPI